MKTRSNGRYTNTYLHIQYNEKFCFLISPSYKKLRSALTSRCADAVILQSNCVQRTLSRSLHSDKAQTRTLHITIGVDFGGGSPGTCPQYLRNAYAFNSYYHPLPPQYFGFPSIFLTGLRQCELQAIHSNHRPQCHN